MTNDERFFRKVEKHDADCPCCDGCWHWRGAATNSTTRGLRYGGILYEGRVQPAHRVGWKMLVGPIPPRATLHHVCRNKLCVNPKHLQLLDVSTHSRESGGQNKKRARAETHCQRSHEWTAENTIRRQDGKRHCKTCYRKAQRDAYERLKNDPVRWEAAKARMRAYYHRTKTAHS